MNNRRWFGRVGNKLAYLVVIMGGNTEVVQRPRNWDVIIVCDIKCDTNGLSVTSE